MKRAAAIVVVSGAAVIGGWIGGVVAACPGGAAAVPVGTAGASPEDATLGYVCVLGAAGPGESGDAVRTYPIGPVGTESGDGEKRTYGYLRPRRDRD